MLIKKVNIFNMLVLILPILAGISIFNYSSKEIDVLILISSFICLLGMLLYTKQNLNIKMLLLFVNLCSLTITLLFHSGFGTAINYINLFLLTVVFSTNPLPKKLIKQVHLWTAIIISVYIFTINTEFVTSSYVIDVFNNRLNANLFGLLALAGLQHAVCYLFYTKIKVRIIFIPMFTIIYSYYILLSDCRSALISAILFYIILTLKKGEAFAPKQFKLIISLILVTSLIFPVVYILMSHTMENIELFGKSIFSGRQIVWLSALEKIKPYPLFGSGNDFLMKSIQGTTTPSSHNMLLGLWKNFGIIPVITLIFNFVGTKNVNKYVNYSVDFAAQAAFLSSIIIVFFESFYLETHLYIFFALFLAHYIKKDVKEDVTNDTKNYPLLLVWWKTDESDGKDMP